MIKHASTSFNYFQFHLYILVFVLLGCSAYRIEKSDLEVGFSHIPITPAYEQYRTKGHSISYIAAGSKKKPKVVFLHGAPGSSRSFIHFLQDTSLTEDAYLIVVDRPGYGLSRHRNSITSLKEQVELLIPLISSSEEPVILVGHSFGGPLAARMAMDYPDLVDALIFIAPAIDPGLEPSEDWFRLPLSATFLRWLLPPQWRAANDELYFLEEELNKMLPLWENIVVPVTIIQGRQDTHVPAGNARFAKEMLVNSPDVEIIVKEELDHFIPWQQPELIKTAIHNHLSQVQDMDTGIR